MMKQLLFSLLKRLNFSAPELSILSHFYQGQSIQVLFQDRAGKKFTHDIQTFARRKDLITQVSSKDAFLLGYLLAEDSTTKTLQTDL